MLGSWLNLLVVSRFENTGLTICDFYLKVLVLSWLTYRQNVPAPSLAKRESVSPTVSCYLYMLTLRIVDQCLAILWEKLSWKLPKRAGI